MMEVELKIIDQKIKKQEERVKAAEERTYHKDNFGRGPWNELARLRTEKELILTGVEWDYYGDGTVIIQNKYIYALKSGKWRTVGNKKWYRSKSLKHFVENYVGK